jgi:hypothetical protein
MKKSSKRKEKNYGKREREKKQLGCIPLVSSSSWCIGSTMIFVVGCLLAALLWWSFACSVDVVAVLLWLHGCCGGCLILAVVTTNSAVESL